jgi:hypothetical protein
MKSSFSISLVLAGVLCASHALADDGASFVDGDWIGTGTFQMGASVVACREIKMRFSGSKDAYVVREASMICGDAPKQDFTDIDSFAIADDGQITFTGGGATKLAKGTKVGAVKDNALRTVNPIEGDNVDDISIRKAGDFLIYNQVAGVPGKTPDYALLAILKKDAAAQKP